MTEINSDESLFRFIAYKGSKSKPCVEGSTRKTRKCTAACVRTNKGDRCTGAADTAAVAAAAASFCCNDAVQKTYRPAQQHDRGSACIKNAADCRGQCLRTGKYVANENPQCTGTRSSRTNEGQCTVAAVSYGAPNHSRCTDTRSCRVNEGQYAGTGTGNYGANNNRCNDTKNYRSNDGQYTGTRNYDANNNRSTETGNYRANDGQCTGTGNYGNNNTRCTDTGNYRANDGQCTVTGNYGTNNSGCGCISAAGCLGVADAFRLGSTDSLVSMVYKWARVAMDWTWDKKSHFLVAAVSYFFGVNTIDWWCLCPSEHLDT